MEHNDDYRDILCLKMSVSELSNNGNLTRIYIPNYINRGNDSIISKKSCVAWSDFARESRMTHRRTRHVSSSQPPKLAYHY